MRETMKEAQQEEPRPSTPPFAMCQSDFHRCMKEEDHDFDSTGQCKKCKAHRRAR